MTFSFIILGLMMLGKGIILNGIVIMFCHFLWRLWRPEAQDPVIPKAWKPTLTILLLSLICWGLGPVYEWSLSVRDLAEIVFATDSETVE